MASASGTTIDSPSAPAAPAPQEFSAQEKRLTIIAIMIVFLLAALDQTIVSTAMR